MPIKEQIESLGRPKPTIRLTSKELSELKEANINDEMVLDDVKVKVKSLRMADEFEIKHEGLKKDDIMATLEIETKDIKVK